MAQFSEKKLTELISAKKQDMRKRHKLYELKNKILDQMYWPSRWSFGIAFFAVFIFFMLAHYGPTNDYWIGFLGCSHYQNLIAVYAGISAIIFALIIFIAESSRDHRDKVRVLLKVSFLFPLLVVTIFGFFNFLWGNINFWSVLFIVGIGISVIFSASKLFLILLNKAEFHKEYINLLKDRFKRSIELAIDERLGYDILLEEVGKIELDYYYYGNDEDKFHCFYSPKEGIITDINLDKLAYFAKRVELEANKQNRKYPYHYNGRMDEFSKKKDQERYLCRTYKDNVADTDVLLCVNKSLIKNLDLIKELEKIVKDIFVITKDDNFSKQIRLELKDTMENFIDAIKNEKMSQIEEYTEIYQILVETLLSLLNNYGIHYTFERAKKEGVIAYKGSNEIRWLLEDIKDIFEVGLKSRNKKIIDELDLLIILIVWKSVSFKNHFVFQQLMDHFTKLYNIPEETDDEFKFFMQDLSLRSLERTYDFIESRFREKKIEKEDLLSLKDFAVYMLILFQNILRNTYEECDVNYFEKVIGSINQRFTRFTISNEDLDLQLLELQLKDSEISEDRSNKLKLQLERNKSLEEIESEIRNRKGQMFYGLAVEIFEKLKSHQDNSNLKSFYLKLEKALPTDLEKFTEVFLSSHNIEAEDFWRWDFILERIPEGTVVPIDVMGKLERYYVIRSLRILENMSEQEIERINLFSDNEDYNRDLYYLAGENQLINFLNEIEDSNYWQFILSEKAFSCTASFKKLLINFKENQEELDRESKRDKKISDTKVEEFKERVLEGFYETIQLRDIFKEFGLYVKEGTTKNKQLKKTGLRVVDDKAAFFDEWHVMYPRWGYEYGRSLAIAENLDITKEIKSRCINIKKKINTENMMEMLNGTLEKFNNLSEVVIFAININTYVLFENFESIYNTEAISQLKGFEGHYKFKDEQIPVFEIYKKEIKDGIMVLNKSKLGKLVQHSPISKERDKKLVKDIFYMNIEPFSENNELIQKVLESSPEWLEKLELDDKRKKLEESVLVYICEKYGYEAEKFEGYFLEFELN